MNTNKTGEYKEGLVIGKFMPPHRGHLELINFALHHAQRVTLAVCSRPGADIAQTTRLAWLREIFKEEPRIHIVAVDENLPRSEIHTPEVSEVWNQYFVEHFNYVEAVFSSEEYGHDLADFMGIDHVVYDLKRNNHPVSGTEIRNNPEAFADYLPACVLAYYQTQV